MRSAVFDPTALFISQADWENEAKRDHFLSHLLDHLNQIDTYKVAKIVWDDELETLLWDMPVPPWRRDTDWKIKLVPIINHRLHQNLQLLDEVEKQSPCNVEPVMICFHARAYQHFLKIMHLMISAGSDVVLCLGIDNAATKNHYTFSCVCYSPELVPDLIRNPNDWFGCIDVEKDYWPESSAEEERFRDALEITRLVSYGGRPFLYTFELAPQFLKTIIDTRSNRENILKQLVRRLTSTLQEAEHDGKLHDECIKQKRERRFRVTPRPTSTRIHYIYSNDNTILFLDYYGKGEHDDGL